MTFALITEGITDYLVIKEILYNFFKEKDIIINQIQPTIDETDRQTSGGGWTEVIKYCDSDEIEEVVLWHDYVIIQIDTDVADDPKINLQMHNKSNNEIYEGMKNILVEMLSQNTEKIDKIIFALGIHQLECWLVGILDKTHSNKKVTNCIYRLNKAIGKTKKYKIIPPEKKENAKETYSKLASSLKKKMDIVLLSKKNIGFEKFIEQLALIN